MAVALRDRRGRGGRPVRELEARRRDRLCAGACARNRDGRDHECAEHQGAPLPEHVSLPRRRNWRSRLIQHRRAQFQGKRAHAARRRPSGCCSMFAADVAPSLRSAGRAAGEGAALASRRPRPLPARARHARPVRPPRRLAVRGRDLVPRALLARAARDVRGDDPRHRARRATTPPARTSSTRSRSACS